MVFKPTTPVERGDWQLQAAFTKACQVQRLQNQLNAEQEEMEAILARMKRAIESARAEQPSGPISEADRLEGTTHMSQDDGGIPSEFDCLNAEGRRLVM